MIYNYSMKKLTPENKTLLKALQAEIKRLQAALVEANKIEGNDMYIDVKIRKNQARFQRVKKKDADDKAVGKFYMEIAVTAKVEPVFIPL